MTELEYGGATRTVAPRRRIVIWAGLAALLPDPISEAITPYLPSNAGSTMFSVRTTPDALSAGTSLLVLLAWGFASRFLIP